MCGKGRWCIGEEVRSARLELVVVAKDQSRNAILGTNDV